MSSIWALQDAKSRFSAVVNRACEIEPQIVTRRGTPVAVLISYGDYKRFAPDQRSALDLLLGGPKIDVGIPVRRAKSAAREVSFA